MKNRTKGYWGRLISLVGEYVKWFEENYGTSFCKERSGVDFYSTMGLLRYFIPGDKVSKCLWHIRGAIRYLYSLRQRELPIMEVQSDEKQDEPIHCAQQVLKGIKEQTGIGDNLLEQLAFVFDGGIGLQGGACGALAGAIECKTITGQKFSGWSDFQNYISSSDKCSALMEFAKDQASIAVEKLHDS